MIVSHPPSIPVPSLSSPASISFPHKHHQPAAQHVPPPHPYTDLSQQSNDRNDSVSSAVGVSSVVVPPASVPPPVQTPPSVSYLLKLVTTVSSDWVIRPFVNGLCFGLGTHLALYSWQRLWMREKPTLPKIEGITTNNNKPQQQQQQQQQQREARTGPVHSNLDRQKRMGSQLINSPGTQQ